MKTTAISQQQRRHQAHAPQPGDPRIEAPVARGGVVAGAVRVRSALAAIGTITLRPASRRT